MYLLARTAVLAAIGALALAPAPSFGQAAPAAPPLGEAQPDAGTVDPAVPEGQPLPRVLPVPPNVLPRIDSGPSMRGADCEHERSPGIGV